jgi:hypothetical protein
MEIESPASSRVAVLFSAPPEPDVEGDSCMHPTAATARPDAKSMLDREHSTGAFGPGVQWTMNACRILRRGRVNDQGALYLEAAGLISCMLDCDVHRHRRRGTPSTEAAVRGGRPSSGAGPASRSVTIWTLKPSRIGR